MFDDLFPKKSMKNYSDSGFNAVFRGYSKIVITKKNEKHLKYFFRNNRSISTECRLPDPWALRFKFKQMEQLKPIRHSPPPKKKSACIRRMGDGPLPLKKMEVNFNDR